MIAPAANPIAAGEIGDELEGVGREPRGQRARGDRGQPALGPRRSGRQLVSSVSVLGGKRPGVPASRGPGWNGSRVRSSWLELLGAPRPVDGPGMLGEIR